MCREDTPCSFRPEGRPAVAATAFPGRSRRTAVSSYGLVRVGSCRSESEPSAARRTEVRRAVHTREARWILPDRASVPVSQHIRFHCIGAFRPPRTRERASFAFSPTANAVPSAASSSWPAPIDFKALLHRRVRSVRHRCRFPTPCTSMGFVPLRGLTRPAAATLVPEETLVASLRDLAEWLSWSLSGRFAGRFPLHASALCSLAGPLGVCNVKEHSDR